MSKLDFSVVSKEFTGYYTAALTDEFVTGAWPEESHKITDEKKIDKVLELRVFNEDGEYKWFRGNIGSEFTYRKLFDSESGDEYEEPIEESQLLDVDSTRLGGRRVHTANGGSYELPFEVKTGDTPCVKVKYYVPRYNPDDKGTVHAYVKDWRLAGFFPKMIKEEGE